MTQPGARSLSQVGKEDHNTRERQQHQNQRDPTLCPPSIDVKLLFLQNNIMLPIK